MQIKVRQSRAFIETFARYTINEKRLLVILIGMLQDSYMGSSEVYTLKAGELAKILKKSSSNISAKAKELTKELRGKTVLIKEAQEAIVLFDVARYERGVFYFQFNTCMVDRFFASRSEGDYIKYDISNFLSLSSIYAQVLYEMILLYAHTSTASFVVTLAALRKNLGLRGGEYDTIKKLRKDVLDKALKQIEERTALRYKFKGVYTGRVWSGVEFYAIHEDS